MPVLMEYCVPRNDSEGDKLKYAVVMLTLFRPWSTVESSPLKSMDTAWPDALHEFQDSLSPEHVRVTLNMQLLYQTRDAKFDFAARRDKRLVELMRKAKNSGIDVDEEGDEDFDPVWENAMQAVVDPEDLDGAVAILSKNTGATRDAENIVNAAKNSGFYCVQPRTNSELISNFEGHTRLGNEDDILNANIAGKDLLKQKDLLINRRLRATDSTEHTTRLHQSSQRIPHALCTTLKDEAG
ncbi:hypothetical protein B0H13DRAFT_1917520 [Mycena leptocephala]|nr:hypothetical protein B0H13DRAFT_1917520 [Mycena leptocephala]